MPVHVDGVGSQELLLDLIEVKNRNCIFSFDMNDDDDDDDILFVVRNIYERVVIVV